MDRVAQDPVDGYGVSDVISGRWHDAGQMENLIIWPVQSM